MKNYCYYLLEKNGYVVVYLSDRETIYEYTSIDVETLPETVQNEVKNGKYIEDMEELYGCRISVLSEKYMLSLVKNL